VPLEKVFKDVSPEVPNVREGIDGRTAGVQFNFGGIDGLEFLQFPAVSVVESNRHRQKVSGSEQYKLSRFLQHGRVPFGTRLRVIGFSDFSFRFIRAASWAWHAHESRSGRIKLDSTELECFQDDILAERQTPNAERFLSQPAYGFGGKARFDLLN
jgi:hypothetical protein